jgi:hypothetical protein
MHVRGCRTSSWKACLVPEPGWGGGTPALLLAIVAALLLTTGCGTTYRTIDPRFAKHPETYGRIEILPVSFQAGATVDKSSSALAGRLAARRVDPALAAAFTNAFSAKGYRVRAPIFIVRDDEQYPFDESTEKALREVKKEFRELLLRYPVPGWRLEMGEASFVSTTDKLPANVNSTRTTALREPFQYRMKSSLAGLHEKFGSADASAVLLVDTSVFFESSAQARKRIWWNSTAGAAFAALEVAVVVAAAASGSAAAGGMPDPFIYSTSYVHHSMALVDLRTQDVLWLEERHCQGRDARKPANLELSISEALTQLPAIGQAALAESGANY